MRVNRASAADCGAISTRDGWRLLSRRFEHAHGVRAGRAPKLCTAATTALPLATHRRDGKIAVRRAYLDDSTARPSGTAPSSAVSHPACCRSVTTTMRPLAFAPTLRPRGASAVRIARAASARRGRRRSRRMHAAAIARSAARRSSPLSANVRGRPCRATGASANAPARGLPRRIELSGADRLIDVSMRDHRDWRRHRRRRRTARTDGRTQTPAAQAP